MCVPYTLYATIETKKFNQDTLYFSCCSFYVPPLFVIFLSQWRCIFCFMRCSVLLWLLFRIFFSFDFSALLKRCSARNMANVKRMRFNSVGSQSKHISQTTHYTSAHIRHNHTTPQHTHT